jgi:2-methylcitrate dehydratase PrpD
VRDRKGRSVEKTVMYVKGHPKNPMRYDDVAAKFRVCARLGRPGWKGADEVIEAVRSLERLDDTAVLAVLCAVTDARAVRTA